MTAKTWTVRIDIDEHGDATDADAVLEMKGKTELRAHGSSRRNPADPQVPLIGDELAAARALSRLAHQLLDTAAAEIEASTHEPAAPHL